MTASDGPSTDPGAELDAALSHVRRARQALMCDGTEDFRDLSAILDQCVTRVARLNPDQRRRLRPNLLALLDELQMTMTAFRTETERLSRDLQQARQNRAAGAAYHRARKL